MKPATAITCLSLIGFLCACDAATPITPGSTSGNGAAGSETGGAPSASGGQQNPSTGGSTGGSGAQSAAGTVGSGVAGSGGAGNVVVPESVTWHQDIAPLAAEKCNGCHKAGGIGPFSLESYEQAHNLAALLANEVSARTMPPWGALPTEECDVQHGWRDDLRLTDQEIALFDRWAELGAPEGDPQSAAPLPEPPSLALEDANLTLQIGATVTVDGNQDQFRCFSLDPELTEDVWVTGLQVTPGNAGIVHHVLVFPDPDGTTADLAGPDGSYPCDGATGSNSPTLLGAWAPGAVPSLTPPDVGMRLASGSRVLLNVHYHPTGAGAEVDDSTAVALRYVTQQPTYEGALLLLGNQLGLSTSPFSIPAGAADHEEGNSIELVPGFNLLLGISSTDLFLWAAGTHMHYVGVDMKIDVTRAAPAAGELPEECLIQTPQWDFNWQRAYVYDAPLSDVPKLGVGDTINLRCRYNNSLENPNARYALDQQGLTEPQQVVLGENTLDEMCLGIFGVAYLAN